MKLYGIPNCGTVKKARLFLESHGIAYEFIDYKKESLSSNQIKSWLEQVGWKKLLKKTGPTWSQLTDEVKASLTDNHSVLPWLIEKPNLIRRPVLEKEGRVIATGFIAEDYESLFP